MGSQLYFVLAQGHISEHHLPFVFKQLLARFPLLVTLVRRKDPSNWQFSLASSFASLYFPLI